MPEVFVKICGIRERGALDAAIDGGANAVGFVFAPGSPRQLDPRTARALVERSGPHVETVGVFRNQPVDEVLDLARESGVSTVQLHGKESREHFDRIAAEGFRLIRGLSSESFLRVREESPSELAGHRLIIDAPNPGRGQRFDTTELMRSQPSGFWLLAGGLDPENVASVLATTSADGVDVSSGVESALGIKDADLIGQFIAAARGNEKEPRR
ncbi:MAG: phosphoribosylanthranilate isomerase [Rhodoglobus sp.]